MAPLSAFSSQARKQICGVLFDIDDTLTTEGQLTAEAYTAIEQLHNAGYQAIPVTGRPAGWCDHIARMWPVDAVVGENGAFYFRYDHTAHTMTRRYVDDDATRARYREQLKNIGAQILHAVPGAAIAADQHYRETDLAIDFCEDVAPLPREAAEKIAALMRVRGLTAKISSIHVNGWFGVYDKLSMTRTLMREVFNVDLDQDRAHYIFAGDSPNDEPMFEFFPHAVGVANINDFGSLIGCFPAYITQARCGAGFAELAHALLDQR